MLFEAAITGTVDMLHEILLKDRLILDKVVVGCLGRSPLHMAASYGHTDFVKLLLNLNPKLARVLDSADRTALHLASAEGHVEVVKELIQAWPGMCLVRDREGKNPLHIAAINGKVEVLEELIKVRPHAARARLNGEGTILHLCVKHHQIDAVKKLLELIKDEEFVKAVDSNSNTILHLAVIGEQLEIVSYITEVKRLKEDALNAKNASGHTAMDIATLAKDNKRKGDPTQIESLLLKAKAKDATRLEEGDWINRNKDALMIVASLIATIAFEVGINPPGGVWQDNLDGHTAGEAVMAYIYPDSYPWFLRFSTIAFIASFSTILLLNSGLHMKKRRYSWLLMVVMWSAITFIAAIYAVGIVWVTPKMDRKSLTRTIVVAVIVFCSVMAILFIVHIVRLLKNIICEKWSIYKAIKHLNILRLLTAIRVVLFLQRLKRGRPFQPSNSHDGRQATVGSV